MAYNNYSHFTNLTLQWDGMTWFVMVKTCIIFVNKYIQKNDSGCFTCNIFNHLKIVYLFAHIEHSLNITNNIIKLTVLYHDRDEAGDLALCAVLTLLLCGSNSG